MIRITCDCCGEKHQIERLEEIADLLAGSHAEAAYRLLEGGSDIGPLEWRRRKIASHGTPAHLLSKQEPH